MKIKNSKIINWFGTNSALIIYLWIALTAINIDKAYHIDDTFHLEAANCIKQNPLKPMSGEINWGNTPTPLSQFNQPPLFFYMIFFVDCIFGDNEVIMHLLLSVFTFLVLVYFSKIAHFLEVKHHKMMLMLFAFCPAFIINQNLMTDVPILAISLGTMYYLLNGLKNGGLINYIKSALLLSIGLLIKYSLLPFLFVILLSTVFSKNYKKSIVLLIPLFILLLWSTWNYFEYSSFHILDRKRSGIQISKIYGFIGALGSMSVYSVVFFYSILPKIINRLFIITVFLLFIVSVPMVYYGVVNGSYYNQLLVYLFICNGFFLLAMVIFSVINSLLKRGSKYFLSSYFPLALYILGFSMFLGFFAPFSATRHVLLVIPFIILFCHKYFEKLKYFSNVIVLIFSIVFGVVFGVSDWVYADFYRKASVEVKLGKNNTWSLGHWGWQWYSKKVGMKIYSTEDDFDVRKNDIVVFPKDISRQYISTEIVLDTIDIYTQTPSFLSFFSGKKFASMYNNTGRKTSWSFSNEPIDTVFICIVKKEIELDDVVIRIINNANWVKKVKDTAVNKGVSMDSMLVIEATEYMSRMRE